jgi:hypothetical protein
VSPAATTAAAGGSLLTTVRNPATKTTTGTIVSSQTTTLEVVPGRSTPLVVSLTGIREGTPTTATCANLPEDAMCIYDDKTQAVTIVPSASTPPGSYKVGVVVTAASETD